MSDDQLDEHDAEATPEAAKVHYFLGRKLEPFSFARQAASQRLRCSGSSIESAVAVVYLCSLGEHIHVDMSSGIVSPKETGIDRIDRARGDAGVREFRREMNQWADENKIGFATINGKEAQRVANEIWEEVFENESEPDVPDAGEDGKKKTES